MLGGPLPDSGRPAAQDRDVERVDADLHELLGRRGGHRRSGSERVERGDRIRLANEALERPVAALLDARRDPGERRQRPEGPTAAGEPEGRDVVLLAVVVRRQGRGLEQVHRPVRPDEPAAGEGRAGRQGDDERRGAEG